MKPLEKSFLPRKAYRKLLRLAAGFVDALRHEREFGEAITANLRGFRGDLLRAVRTQLRMRRGRPTDPLLDRACGLLRQGKSVADVLRAQIPRYDTRDKYERYLLEKGLRQASKRRKKSANRAKNPRRNSDAEKGRQNEPPN
jgi:hypothetical protein